MDHIDFLAVNQSPADIHTEFAHIPDRNVIGGIEYPGIRQALQKFHADIDNDSVVNRLQEIVLDGDNVRSSMKTAHNIDFFDESHRMRGRLKRSRISGGI